MIVKEYKCNVCDSVFNQVEISGYEKCCLKCGDKNIEELKSKNWGSKKSCSTCTYCCSKK